MSILSHCAGGTLLGKPENNLSRCGETYDELKQRIYDGLLPAQKEFCDDTDHLILGLCAGFGAGKTRALCAKALLLAMDNVVERFKKFHLDMRRREDEIERHVEFLEQSLLTRAEVAKVDASSHSSKWVWPFLLLVLLICIGGFVCFRRAREVLSQDQWFYTNRAGRKSRWVD